MEKAQHLLHELDPLRSVALLHAAIAGVWLFLAGLISGYFDNKAAYDRIGGRVAHLRWLQAVIGPERARWAITSTTTSAGSPATSFSASCSA